MEYDWDEDNIAHIARHSISVAEVEYALEQWTKDRGHQNWHDHEERFEEVGVTASGRFLTIITTWREDRIRVVTAYDSPLQQQREYLRAMGARGTVWD